MVSLRWILCAIALIPFYVSANTTILAPVDLDSPQDTMRTFMTAMEDYRKGVDAGEEKLMARIGVAIKVFDLRDAQGVVQKKTGEEAAQLLKEILDRVWVVNYSQIPDKTQNVETWRVPNTEIRISKMKEGDRSGNYLVTWGTVKQLKSYYNKVKDLPYLAKTGGGAHYFPPLAERSLPAWAQESVLFFPNWKWIGIFLSILIGLFIKSAVRFLLGLFTVFTKKSRTDLDDRMLESVRKPAGLVVASAFWFFCIHLLDFSGTALSFLVGIVQVAFTWGIIWIFYRLADIFADYLDHLAKKTDFPLDDQLSPMVHKALKIFIVIFGVLVGLQNIGVNVMSVVAGLGLGGLAFALAAKDTAANLFGSIMILLDRPFRVGEWIVADGVEGTVEEIGFRSTRVRTFYNSLVSLPNAQLANANIDNMGLRRYRRIKTTLGLTYDTPPEKMEAFLEGIKNILRANPNIRQDFMHVVFNGYGPHSLDILLYCFLEVKNWSMELVEKQNIFLEILRLSKEVGVEFAFPTETLHVASFPEKQSSIPQHIINEDQLKTAAKAFGPKGGKSKPSGLGYFKPPYEE